MTDIEVAVCRRKIMVNSFIYYKLGDNIISDSQYDQLCVQAANTRDRKIDIFDDIFNDFTGETGFHLLSQVSDSHYTVINNVARRLLKEHYELLK